MPILQRFIERCLQQWQMRIPLGISLKLRIAYRYEQLLASHGFSYIISSCSKAILSGTIMIIPTHTPCNCRCMDVSQFFPWEQVHRQPPRSQCCMEGLQITVAWMVTMQNTWAQVLFEIGSGVQWLIFISWLSILVARIQALVLFDQYIQTIQWQLPRQHIP